MSEHFKPISLYTDAIIKRVEDRFHSNVVMFPKGQRAVTARYDDPELPVEEQEMEAVAEMFRAAKHIAKINSPKAAENAIKVVLCDWIENQIA